MNLENAMEMVRLYGELKGARNILSSVHSQLEETRTNSSARESERIEMVNTFLDETRKALDKAMEVISGDVDPSKDKLEKRDIIGKLLSLPKKKALQHVSVIKTDNLSDSSTEQATSPNFEAESTNLDTENLNNEDECAKLENFTDLHTVIGPIEDVNGTMEEER